MVEYHVLDTHEAVARVLGSKMFTTRSSTCHGIIVSCVGVVIALDYGFLMMIGLGSYKVCLLDRIRRLFVRLTHGTMFMLMHAVCLHVWMTHE